MPHEGVPGGFHAVAFREGDECVRLLPFVAVASSARMQTGPLHFVFRHHLIEVLLHERHVSLHLIRSAPPALARDQSSADRGADFEMGAERILQRSGFRIRPGGADNRCQGNRQEEGGE